MEIELKNRLEKLLEYLDINQKKLSKVTGISENTLSNALNSKNVPVLEFFNAIYKSFPELNPEWLYMGEGPMLKKEKKLDKDFFEVKLNEDQSTIESYLKEIEIAEKKIAVLQYEVQNKKEIIDLLRKETVKQE